MSLVEVSCPRCHAPVDVPSGAETTKCRFCGASLRDASAPPAKTRIVAAVMLERVGPSNRARAWDVLTKIGGLAPADAQHVVESAPCEAVVLEQWELAEELGRVLRAGGVGARVEERQIVIPAPVVLPERSVHLDAVGKDRPAVMKIIREHVDCGMLDAKAMVDRAPCVLVRAREGTRAAAFVDALTAAGALAHLDSPT
jgi:ribosomal protein L7/L12